MNNTFLSSVCTWKDLHSAMVNVSFGCKTPMLGSQYVILHTESGEKNFSIQELAEKIVLLMKKSWKEKTLSQDSAMGEEICESFENISNRLKEQKSVLGGVTALVRRLVMILFPSWFSNELQWNERKSGFHFGNGRISWKHIFSHSSKEECWDGWRQFRQQHPDCYFSYTVTRFTLPQPLEEECLLYSVEMKSVKKEKYIPFFQENLEISPDTHIQQNHSFSSNGNENKLVSSDKTDRMIIDGSDLEEALQRKEAAWALLQREGFDQKQLDPYVEEMRQKELKRREACAWFNQIECDFDQWWEKDWSCNQGIMRRWTWYQENELKRLQTAMPRGLPRLQRANLLDPDFPVGEQDEYVSSRSPFDDELYK